jgi:N-hydroxyarylamine O-acetyltransferase
MRSAANLTMCLLELFKVSAPLQYYSLLLRRACTVNTMNVERTLERIRYPEPRTDPSVETLRALQRSFLLAVPFENLDIHWGRHIEFTPDAVFQKVVNDGRGGFCYELNSLFHDLLAALGFDVFFLAARMWREGYPGTVMGHMILGVSIAGHTWITDVGNGKSAREPLLIDGSNETTAEGISYRAAQTEIGLAVLETTPAGEWQIRFIFDPMPRRRDEFHEVCEWTQTSPESRFTQHRICTLATANGRVLLLDDKLTITEGDRVEERILQGREWEQCLKPLFGIEPQS